MREQKLFFPGARPVDRERLDRFIRRQRAVQDQAALRGSIFTIELVRGLETVNPLFGRIYRGTHPDPIGCVILVGFQ
jgi:hypothetical protein